MGGATSSREGEKRGVASSFSTSCSPPPFPEKQKPAHVEENEEKERRGRKTRINILTFPFSHKTISHKSPKNHLFFFFRENQGGGKGTLRRFLPPLTKGRGGGGNSTSFLPLSSFPSRHPLGRTPMLPPQGVYPTFRGRRVAHAQFLPPLL